ncbi:GNAT family N-acetyltransferase [Oricola sp.]|uniref:GNAT family N-acetyltransferase n=1 Tax=Oricola sp. TaxID=1979950 RepID=UPI0025FAA325|nr:GNAT family N-acetyltransferase [Oricola sp.]MCI5074766.1 GNAT family N-acetyltransferase [Oricola sp.]
MSDGYALAEGPPSAEDFVRLRAVAGLSPFSLEAARIALPNTIFAVRILHDGTCIGMGRIVGDGGCFFQITDIAVDPGHRKRGLGKRIVAALTDHLRRNAPSGAYVSLIADGEARNLYAQFGFRPTAPPPLA